DAQLRHRGGRPHLRLGGGARARGRPDAYEHHERPALPAHAHGRKPGPVVGRVDRRSVVDRARATGPPAALPVRPGDVLPRDRDLRWPHRADRRPRVGGDGGQARRARAPEGGPEPTGTGRQRLLAAAGMTTSPTPRLSLSSIALVQAPAAATAIVVYGALQRH